MLLARFAPVESKRYKALSEKAKNIEKLINWLPMELFGIWTVFVTGMSVGNAQIDRHYFWDWRDWLIGIIGIAVITIILNLISNRFNSFSLSPNNMSYYSQRYNILIAIFLLFSGFILTSGFSSMRDLIVYLLPYSAIFIIHTILVDPNSDLIPKESNKHIKSLLSIFLLIVAIVIGSFNDDPLVATASMVTLPFVLVLLFGKHLRHLERAKFYPIFIFAMFVCSREAWFIIPIFLLFHFLRSYNYLVNQKIYPTFGVSE